MAEMNYVNSLKDLKNGTLNQTKFDKNGEVTNGLNYYAEIISANNSINYFIKTFGSSIYDPYGPYSKRESVLDLKLKKVSLKTFNNYLEYLKTKNLKHFTIAQRGFIDDRA